MSPKMKGNVIFMTETFILKNNSYIMNVKLLGIF